MYVLSTVYRDPTAITALHDPSPRARGSVQPSSDLRSHLSPPQPSQCPHCTNYALQLLWPTSLRQGGLWATRGSRGAHTGVSASGAPGPTWQGPPTRGHVCTRTHTPPIVVVRPVTDANEKREFGFKICSRIRFDPRLASRRLSTRGPLREPSPDTGSRRRPGFWMFCGDIQGDSGFFRALRFEVILVQLGLGSTEGTDTQKWSVPGTGRCLAVARSRCSPGHVHGATAPCSPESLLRPRRVAGAG